jgi:hypothetical protein
MVDTGTSSSSAELQQTAMYFVVFMILSVVIYSGLPFLYDGFTSIIIGSEKNDACIKVNALRFINTFLIIWGFSIGLCLFLYGGLSDQTDSTLSTTGLWIISITIMGILCFTFNNELMKKILPEGNCTNESPIRYCRFGSWDSFLQLHGVSKAIKIIVSGSYILWVILIIIWVILFILVEYYVIDPQDTFGIFIASILILLFGIPLSFLSAILITTMVGKITTK